MKSTNLNVFIQLGSQLQYLSQIARVGQEWGELFLYSAPSKWWLEAFINETAEYADSLKDSRVSAQRLLDHINLIFSLPQGDWMRPITQNEVTEISQGKDDFEKNFEREHRNIDVFTVTPKGLYNTRLLIEQPEIQFPERMRAVLSAQVVYDLKQAGRCLAFDVPTACAFHVCRGTEALMFSYYAHLKGHEWKIESKTWKRYIEELVKEGAPKKITNRLEEIRATDRNAYAHPEINISLEEAQVIYTLCAGVNYYMAEEMTKI